MECPKCKIAMDFEEIKNFYGFWYCGECEYEVEGSRIPISDGDGIMDYEETKEDKK